MRESNKPADPASVLLPSGGPASTASPIVGESSALRLQLALLDDFAMSDAPVYIYGQTGTGKELIARSIHKRSRRAHQRFVAQNCAALPDTLLQSLLFGHRRGAFTGAERDQMGIFEAAAGGTLLLDEVGEMSPPAQAALLRVLQEKEVSRLGDVAPRRIDVRVISASNRVLEDEVEAGRFRRDLYFRLVTLRIELPPLRERASDLPMLVHHFIRDYVDRTGKPIAGIDATTLAALQSRDWPGNVRELQAEIERACVVTPANGAITSSCLAPWRHPPLPDAGPTFRVAERGASHATLPEILGQVERHLLAEALQDAKGNKTAAAKSLGISRQRYTKRLRRWGLEP